MTEYTAVQLFVQSARRIRHDFEPKESNLNNIIRICQLVEGMPLGLELAAGWVDMISTTEVADEIEKNLDFLETDLRNIPARQRSMRAVFDASWGRLSEEERHIFSKLSVFQGGFTRQSAKDVAGASLRQLAALSDKSLLQYNRSAQRYQIHELLRQFGLEELEKSGEIESTQDQHLSFFLSFAEETEPKLESAEQITWLNKLELEDDNLRAALSWCMSAKHSPELGLRLAGSLSPYWQMRGFLTEGRQYLLNALSLTSDSVQSAERAKALYEVGRLAHVQGDLNESRRYLMASVSIYRKLGGQHSLSLAHVLIMLGDTLRGRGNYPEALSVIREGLQIMQTLDEADGFARASWKLGWCLAGQGEYENAIPHFLSAIQHYRDTDNKGGEAMALAGLGDVLLRQGNLERAAVVVEESLALRRELGEKVYVAASIGALGWIALRRNSIEEAVTHIFESLAMRREMDDRGGIAWCLEKLAEIAVIQGQLEPVAKQEARFQQAVLLFSTAHGIRTATGSTMDLEDRIEYERRIILLKSLLGETNFHQTWEEGQTLHVEDHTHELLQGFASN
jgi:tetratricopeptide (TPR) repeat protein